MTTPASDLVVRSGQVVTDGAKRSSGDSSMKGYKGLLKIDRAAAREKDDLIIKTPPTARGWPEVLGEPMPPVNS